MSYINQSIILFFSVLIGGISAFFISRINIKGFKYSLIFVGSYLFSITILHILPDLYNNYNFSIGLFIIIGFFIQLILEYFSEGIEHGHIHEIKKDISQKSSLKIFIPLCLHALLDSLILLKCDSCETHILKNELSILIGIILHKIPAAFALVIIISSINNNKLTILIYLIIFALASPFGLLLGSYFLKNWTDQNLNLMKALAGGSFLSISTTIFFESTPDHSINGKKIFISVCGILLAILTEFAH